MTKMILRYLAFVAGLYFLACGIVLIVSSDLGTTPISSVNYVVSLNTPLTLGTCTFIINVLLILGQLWLVRDFRTRKDLFEIFLQVPFSFIFAAFIDLNMELMSGYHPDGYGSALLLLAAGCLCQAVGVVLEIKPDVAVMSAEGFVKYASRRYRRDFGRLKVRFDVTLVAMAVMLSLALTGRVEGVREGTVIAAVATGYVVNFLSRHVFTRNVFGRLAAKVGMVQGVK